MLNLLKSAVRTCAATVILALLAACQTVSTPESVLVVEHVTVLPMTESAAPIQDVSVVIRDGRIAEIGPGDRVHASSGAERIDGRGRFLMPGLTDMHTHPENAGAIRMLTRSADSAAPTTQDTEDVFLPFIANGVTQILNMSANADAIAQRDAIERGEVLGPHMALAAMVDGVPPLSPFATTVDGPEAAVRFVRGAHADGYDFIKVYSELSPEAFDAAVEEARRQGMRVVGHIPGRGAGTPERYLGPDFAMVAHAEEFAFQGASVDRSEASIPEYVALLRRSGVQLTSTLSLDERIVEQARDPASVNRRTELRFLAPAVRGYWTQANPYASQGEQYADFVSSIVAFNARMVRASYEAGVPILPGTDANVPGVAPGFSLHDELEALSRAGLPNRYILESATRRAAEFLQVSDDRGTVEAGKRADLLLLDADPLADVANTRRIAAVILGGRVVTAAELQTRMEALAARRAG